MKLKSLVTLLLSTFAVACQQADGPTPQMPSAEPAAAGTPAAQPSAAQPAPQASTAGTLLPRDSEWAPLFIGTTLDNFTMVGDATWNVVDDYVESSGDAEGFLVTRGNYGDFAMRLEFWTSPDANSGVFARCQDVDNIGAETCYEFNIFDQRPDPTYRTGAIVNIAEPMAQMDAANRWNTFEITVEGPRLVLRMNDTLMADVEDERFTSGPIALQHGAGVVRFRNVYIRPL